MTITLPCPRCGDVVVAEDEDDLVEQMQAHARDHGGARGTHIPTREHVLAHLHKQDRETNEN